MTFRTSIAGRAVRACRYAACLSTLVVTFAACNRGASQPPVPSMGLSSASFSGDIIPDAGSSCAGQTGASPELRWQAPPAGTKSFALIAYDEDSPFGIDFVHWVLYDLPAETRSLPGALAMQEQLADGSRQGLNGYDRIGYVGPCPPGHSPHRYVFDLYALDTKLNLPPGASRKQLVKAIQGHVLARGELVGRYQH